MVVQTQNQKKCKGGKHVSFPPDGQIVSGFAERKENSRHGDNLTLEEVIVAYQKSCEKHQVDPKSSILQQLEVPGVSGRVSCLDLKGERLDQHSCESLEVILKWLHFDFINLQETELEENGASSLLDMILYYESTKHLDISGNRGMGISGWRALSHLIKQSVCLWRLDVCNVSMQEYPAQALSKALLTSRLAVLRLQSTCLSGRPLFTLVGALRTNTVLQELYLGDNQLNSYQDSMQLGDLLKYNHTLQVLDLSNNSIADLGVEELCEGLRVQTSGLRALLLNDNHITHHGLLHLAKALPVLRRLERLELAENRLENRGLQALREALMMNRSLLQLRLDHTHITCEGAVALAEYVAESRQIQGVDISGNEVRVGGLMALSLALRINRSLTTLHLEATSTDEQEEFLVETELRLRREIVELCRANAADPARIATETEPEVPASPPRPVVQSMT
ncbi:protein phosphatase 1 regulatory subunit 37 [Aplochiton taeniatus]